MWDSQRYVLCQIPQIKLQYFIWQLRLVPPKMWWCFTEFRLEGWYGIPGTYFSNRLLILKSAQFSKNLYLLCIETCETFQTSDKSKQQYETKCKQVMYNVLCRNNDKFPSSSIVNCCTDVTFSVKFQQLIPVQMFKVWLFLIGYCIFFKSPSRRF